MNVLEIVLPVLVMIVVGMLCRKWKILTRDGINNMKVLVTNVMLPVAIFHALATAEYNKETGILILIMFVMLVVSFGLGFLLKPFLKGTYQKYLPFMVSVYEGGLWPIRYIRASVAVKIFPVLQFWILPDCCLDSVYIWECWDRWKTVRRLM